MQRNASGSFVVLGSLLCLCSLNSACGKDSVEEYKSIEYGRVFEQAELDRLVEGGLDNALPTLAPEQFELYLLRRQRPHLAESMRMEAKSAMAPAALAISLFAIEGIADIVLALAPVHKIGRVRELFRHSPGARHRGEIAQNADKFVDEMHALTGQPLDELVRIGRALGPVERAALTKLRAATKSTKATRKLLVLHIAEKADIRWIAKQLDSGPFDKDFVRRFSFDGDTVRAYTTYSANPSWRTLQQIAENAPIPAKTRDSLASKVTGLLGEQAAANLVRSPGFRNRYFGREYIQPSLARGVGYGRNNRSIDIIASTRDHVVFAEVKNWSYVTWSSASKRDKVVAQLERHNDGVGDMMVGRALTGRPNKLLMVRKEGYEMLDDDVRSSFEQKIRRLGWIVERMPSRYIPDFSDFLDSLK